MSPPAISCDLWVERGGSSGPLLVLLHGLAANGSVWNAMLEAVESSWEGRWAIPDLRGHGRSPFQGPYGVGTHAADIAKLIADEPQDSVIVIGHSFGGLVGALLASGWFGPRLRQLIAIGVKIDWTDAEIVKHHEIARKPPRIFEKRADAELWFLKTSGLIGIEPTRSSDTAGGVRTLQEGFAVAVDPGVYTAVGAPVERILRLANCPIILGAGEFDPMVDADTMARIDPRPIIFPGLAHNAHRQAPDRVWNQIQPRLARPGSGEGRN